MNASDFVPGSCVKVVGPFSPGWRHLDSYVGETGWVLPPEFSDDWMVDVRFASDERVMFPPSALERGRREWVPEGETAWRWPLDEATVERLARAAFNAFYLDSEPTTAHYDGPTWRFVVRAIFAELTGAE